MWDEIVALYGHYPTQLVGLKQGWWNRAWRLLAYADDLHVRHCGAWRRP
jgi:hypothetical protein